MTLTGRTDTRQEIDKNTQGVSLRITSHECPFDDKQEREREMKERLREDKRYEQVKGNTLEKCNCNKIKEMQ